MSEQTPTALLPCPFCGNDGGGSVENALHIIHNEHDHRPESWSVQCDKCTATMGYSDSEDDAIESWNTRTPDAAIDKLEFSNEISKRGSSHRADLIEALARYDGADFNMRVTSGETLDHWSIERRSAGSDIEEIIGDIDPVDIARHILFSPAL